MNIKLFEDRNWFQLIRNKVIRLSNGSIRKQDFLSILMIVNVIVFIIGIMKSTFGNSFGKIFQILISFLISLMLSINSIFDFFLGKVDEVTIWQPNIPDNLIFLDIFSDFLLLIFKIILFGILYSFTFKFFFREKFINEVIKLILSTIVTIIIFGEYQFTLSAVLILIMASLIQFGKGNLFRLLSICLLFLSPTSELQNNVGTEKNTDLLKITIWTFFWLMTSKLISIWFKIPIEVAVLLVIVLMLRFSLQLQTKKPRIEILGKGAIYFLVFITVINDNNITDKILSLITVSTAIYFAVDSFFSLFKEVGTLVQNDEINYLLYFDSSIELLEQKFLPDEFLTSVIMDIDDQKLYGQLIIRAKIGMKGSFNKLLLLVKAQREYKGYQLLLLACEYELQRKENKTLTIVNFIEDNVHNEILFDDQIILPIEFLVWYGSELKEKKEYEQASKYLSFAEYYDSYTYINSYFDCIKMIGDEEELNRLQKKYILH